MPATACGDQCRVPPAPTRTAEGAPATLPLLLTRVAMPLRCSAALLPSGAAPWAPGVRTELPAASADAPPELLLLLLAAIAAAAAALWPLALAAAAAGDAPATAVLAAAPCTISRCVITSTGTVATCGAHIAHTVQREALMCAAAPHLPAPLALGLPGSARCSGMAPGPWRPGRAKRHAARNYSRPFKRNAAEPAHLCRQAGGGAARAVGQRGCCGG